MKYRNYYEMIKAVQPDRVALIEDGRIYTYGDIIRQADVVSDRYKGILAGSPEKIFAREIQKKMWQLSWEA